MKKRTLQNAMFSFLFLFFLIRLFFLESDYFFVALMKKLMRQM